MSNLFERSILMTLGAAMLTKEMAESLADNLAQKGEETTSLGREAVDEAVEQGQGRGAIPARTLRYDPPAQLSGSRAGSQQSEVEELKLKMAQLEHRMSLLEAASTYRNREARTCKGVTARHGDGAGEGVIGEAVSAGNHAKEG